MLRFVGGQQAPGMRRPHNPVGKLVAFTAITVAALIKPSDNPGFWLLRTSLATRGKHTSLSAGICLLQHIHHPLKANANPKDSN